jgi:hypothetical protein
VAVAGWLADWAEAGEVSAGTTGQWLISAEFMSVMTFK